MSDENDMLDDEITMEEWMAMSDKQQEIELSSEMDKFNRWYDAMSLQQQIRYHTRSALRNIMENRRRLRTPELCTIEYVVGLWREGIRSNQRRLVKIRTWRSTGIYPGEA